MHRPSVAYGRASQLASSASSAAATHKLIEKKKEFDAVTALEVASAVYLQRLQDLAADCEVMADAGQVHGKVLEQWPKMFEILSQFLSAKQLYDQDAATAAPVMGERLVRLPIEEMQNASPSSS